MRVAVVGVLLVIVPACNCGMVDAGDGGAPDVLLLDVGEPDANGGESNPIVDISGNGSAFCARRAHGEWRCWGQGLPENVPNLDALPTLADEVAPGVWAVCVVVDRQVTCAGRPLMPPNPIEMPPRGSLHDVAPDAVDACAIDAEGDLQCWGLAPTYLALASVLEVRGSASGQYCARTADDVVCFQPGLPEYMIRVGLPASRLAGQGQSVRCWLSPEGRPRCDTRCIDEEIGLPPRDCTGTEWDTEVGPLPDAELLQLEIAEGYLACGIHPDHTLECWGSAYTVERTAGSSLAANTPRGELWSDIAIGDGLCGITLDGRLLCWNDLGPSTDVPAF